MRDARSRIVSAAIRSVIEELEHRTLFATFVVTNPFGAGMGTLRQAIQDANSLPGHDLIEFDILGGGPHTIMSGTPMPEIFDSVTIDATTQPGYMGEPIIELSGLNAPFADGLVLRSPQSSGSTIKGLVVNNWKRSGIRIENGSSNNQIVGNWIGLAQFGVAPAPNLEAGVFVQNAGGNNRIGGPNIADRNVISGNQNAGIQIVFTSNTVMLGNYIGTNPTGDVAFGNSQGIFMVDAFQSVVGGPSAGERNLISGNVGNGVFLVNSSENIIQGNHIGSRAGGTGALPNFGFGIDVGPNSSDNSIGGPLGGQGNIIVHNSAGGLQLMGDNNSVHDNSIGVDALGNAAGNFNDGITIDGGRNNFIGEAGANDGNIIANNGGAGVAIVGNTARGNAIRNNRIFANGGLGIDIQRDGIPQPNDPMDPDEGANFLQNYPVITSAVSSGGSTTITGTLNSTPNTTFVIELFVNLAPDPSGFGEGQRLIAAPTITTDAAGNATFTVTVAENLLGQFITATATDVVRANTSEFSAARAVIAAQPPPPPPEDDDKDKKDKKDKEDKKDKKDK